MWTSYFIVLVVVVLVYLALAYVSALFESRNDLMRALRIAGVVAIAAAYCGYRAFW